MSLASLTVDRWTVSAASAREGQRMELSTQIPAAAIDEEHVSRRYLVGPEKCESDHPAGCRGPSAARDLADLSGPLRHLVAMDRRNVGVHAETE